MSATTGPSLVLAEKYQVSEPPGPCVVGQTSFGFATGGIATPSGNDGSARVQGSMFHGPWKIIAATPCGKRSRAPGWSRLAEPGNTLPSDFIARMSSTVSATVGWVKLNWPVFQLIELVPTAPAPDAPPCTPDISANWVTMLLSPPSWVSPKITP